MAVCAFLMFAFRKSLVASEDKIAELLIDKGEGAVSAVAISADNGEIKVDAL